MLLKVLNGFSQAAIIILALVLITTIITRHSSNAALEDFQRQVEERFQSDNLTLNSKIKTVEDNLNRYQQLRENRAIVYSEKIDKLYDLYKKDPAPIVNANPSPAQVVADVVVPAKENVTPVSDNNFTYLEMKVNKVSENSDNRFNRLDSKVNVLEQKILLLQSNNPSGVKVIQTNLNQQTVINDK